MFCSIPIFTRAWSSSVYGKNDLSHCLNGCAQLIVKNTFRITTHMALNAYKQTCVRIPNDDDDNVRIHLPYIGSLYSLCERNTAFAISFFFFIYFFITSLFNVPSQSNEARRFGWADELNLNSGTDGFTLDEA